MADVGTFSDSRDGLLGHWTLKSPARLHFGLLEICSGEPNLFGGLGVTLDEPATQLSVAIVNGNSSEDSFWKIKDAGPWQTRMESVAENLRRDIFNSQMFANALNLANSHSIVRLDGPPEAHAGLGSGTQLACSVATSIACLYLPNQKDRHTLTAADIWEHSLWSDNRSAVRRLAEATARGARSYVGLAAHLYGGLIVDRGISDASDAERVTERLRVPDQWHTVLIRPSASTTVSGTLETDYFAQCAVPNPSRQQMLHIIEEEITPSIRLSDFARFGEAIYQYGRYAGEIFTSAQGGIYRDKDVAGLVEAVRAFGVRATGQTSWGPTVYAIVESCDSAELLQRKLKTQFGSSIVSSVTRLTNEPATICYNPCPRW